MKFDKTAYYIPNNTKNKTNIKNFNNLKNDFSFYADFKLNKFIEDEALIVGRKGYHMGIFLQKPNYLKFSWYTENNVYNDISVSINDIYKPLRVFVSVSDVVNIKINDDLVLTKEKGEIVNYIDSEIYIGSINPFGDFFDCWFDGEINKIVIFDKALEKFDENDASVYTNLDFKINSKFKTFDKSKNGNHGIIVEDPKYSTNSINKFNKIAPKQKII